MGASDPETFHPYEVDTLATFQHYGCRVLAETEPWQISVTTYRFKMPPGFSLAGEIVKMAKDVAIRPIWLPVQTSCTHF